MHLDCITVDHSLGFTSNTGHYTSRDDLCPVIAGPPSPPNDISNLWHLFLVYSQVCLGYILNIFCIFCKP